MNIACPECSTIYRVDPERVPEDGVTTRCRECETEFRVNHAMATEPGAIATASRVQAASAVPGAPVAEPDPVDGDGPEPDWAQESAQESAQDSAPEEAPEPEPAGADVADETHGAEEAEEPAPAAAKPGGAPAFGPQDPETRARRLARALVSDIKVYHPDRWEESAKAGTLRGDFRDEILKSWEEYVEQVGEEMAKKTPFFRDALNEILAQGDRVF